MKKRIILSLLLIFLIITGCESLNPFPSDSGRQIPSWVNRPNVRGGRIAYVNEGSGASEEAARVSAIENALEELGSDLGLDAYATYYRELSTTGTISDLDGRITNTYYQSYGSSRYSCFTLLDISQERFLQMQTPETRALVEAMNQIEALMDEARNFYMQNRDLDAISKTLDALIISLDSNVTEEDLDPQSLLDLAIYYLEPLDIRYSQNRDTIDGEITLRRRRGILFPLVYSANLVASYTIRDSLGEIREESITFNTGESGRYNFHNTNTYIVPSGTLVFNLGLEMAKIDEVRSKASTLDLSEFEEMLASKTASFTYQQERSSSYNFDVLISHYDIHGAELNIDTAIIAFNEEIKGYGYSIEALQGYGDDDEEVLSSYLESGGRKSRLVIIRAGIADSVVLSENRTLIYVETTLGIYDTASGELIYSDNNTAAVGDGNSYDDAMSEAFSEAGKILASAFIIDL